MKASEKTGAYAALSLLEDLMDGGYARPRAPARFNDDGLGPGLGSPSALAESAPAAVRQELFAPAETQSVQVPGDDSLERIVLEVSACAACRLSARRNRAVPGMGVPSPLVLVVGEGPGAEEDAQGLPFVGPAGQLLDKMLQSISLSRQENCYIANIVKCRPPGNRTPESDESAACLPFLVRQIAILKPRFILAAGRTAAQALLGTSEGINKLRGRRLDYRGIPLMATFHPSALLHDSQLKRPAWEDLKAFRAMIDDAQAH
jgi:uracil-DNA glycosylase